MAALSFYKTSSYFVFRISSTVLRCADIFLIEYTKRPRENEKKKKHKETERDTVRYGVRALHYY